MCTQEDNDNTFFFLGMILLVGHYLRESDKVVTTLIRQRQQNAETLLNSCHFSIADAPFLGAHVTGRPKINNSSS